MAIQFPDEFKCPISLDIMSDPVIIQSGHTFDRPSIQRWLDAGHRTCPITKLPLPEHPLLIPNHALRSLISNFTLVAPQKSTAGALTEPNALISSLLSRSFSLESKLHSVTQLARLTKHDSVFRRRLTESGAVPAILKLIDSGDPFLQEKSLSLLLNLSLDDDNKIGLVAEGAITRVVGVLRSGSPDSKAVAATLLTSLGVVEVNKATIGAYPDAIRALVMLLRDGKGREKKEAATALYALCSYPDNRRQAVVCGAVSILIRVANSGMERAIEVLCFLVKCSEGRHEMVNVSGCVRVLVKVLKNGTPRGVQHSLFTLNCLCCYSDEICREVMREGGMGVCMGFMADENEKIRRSASSLVQTLGGDCLNV